MKSAKATLLKIVSNQMFIPIVAILILTIVNLIGDPSFFAISYGENSEGAWLFSGNPVNIIDNGTSLAMLAIGMTLVTAASGGQDISVGAAMAIAAGVIIKMVSGELTVSSDYASPLIVALLVALLASMLCGLFNGVLVSFLKIQPMVATLVLYTAGRSIAGWITGNLSYKFSAPSFKAFGHTLPGIPIPTPIIISVVCFILIALVLKFTTLGLYVQSVGINENSARLNGLNPIAIKLASYVILGVCVCVAGFVTVTRTGTFISSTFAKDIEMDAILAVALGGNALSGGKFNIASSVIGAYVIQYLKTTLNAFGVEAVALPAYKALVIIALVIISSPSAREWFVNKWRMIMPKSKNTAKEVA
ncbi:MAG: ABC transporter permease [Lachnospiraceae bacterium]|nr:ABC transporter permease [Lachnospiraceae bacterium]